MRDRCAATLNVQVARATLSRHSTRPCNSPCVYKYPKFAGSQEKSGNCGKVCHSRGRLESSLMLIADAHLDLAYNALRNRDVLRRAAEQQPDAEGIPTVGLPDLRAGSVGLVCATIFCLPSIDGKPGYHTP